MAISAILVSLFFVATFISFSRGDEPTLQTAPVVPSEAPSELPGEDETIGSIAGLLLSTALLISFSLGLILHKTGFKYLTPSGGAIIVGLILGCIVRYTKSADSLQKLMVFTPSTFFLYLLPPIIFESGYNMNKTLFFYNIGSISMFVFLGTFINFLCIGGFIYFVSELLRWTYRLTLVEAMLYGALMSATDTVTILAIFSDLRVDRHLTANVEGESLLNDALALALYNSFVGLLNQELQPIVMLSVALDFLRVVFGSFGMALLFGITSTMLFKYITMGSEVLEIIFIILFAFASYVAAETAKLSGIITILFCGVFISHYTIVNVSPLSRDTMGTLFKVMAGVAEMIVFMYLGLAVFTYKSQEEYSISFIGFTIVIMLISRAISTFPLALIVNLWRPRHHHIPLSHQVIIWIPAGLRGAMSFALALNIPTHASRVLFTTTLVIAILSVLVLGGTAPLLIKLLKINTEEADSEEKDGDAEVGFSENSWWTTIDKKFLFPFFTWKKYDEVEVENEMQQQQELTDFHTHRRDSDSNSDSDDSNLSLKAALDSPRRKDNSFEVEGDVTTSI